MFRSTRLGAIEAMAEKLQASALSAPSQVKPYFGSRAGEAQLVDGWKEIAVDKLGELADSNRALRVFLDSCVKCGACTDKCHYYIGGGDPNNMPVARQDLVRGVYRRYHTLPGRMFPKLVGALDLTEELIDQWSTYFYQCSECRRCTVYCPFGIDTAEVTIAARSILDQIGLRQRYIHTVIDNARRVGNNLGMPGDAIVDTLESLEEEVREDTGVDVRFPLDDQDAELILVVPSADLYSEPHVDGLIGIAKIFHSAGIRWTLSSEASEAANFGLFIGDRDAMGEIASRIWNASEQLGIGQVVIGECGHAWRVASNYWQNLDHGRDQAPRSLPRHICEVTHGLLTSGRLKLDSSAHADKVITFHDSCNIARGSRMGTRSDDVFRMPRDLLRASCDRFVDMSAKTIREQTLCCGAGGGLLTDELMEIRLTGAKPRVHALEQVIAEHGVTHMASICAICKSQFNTVLPKFGLGMDMIVSLHQVVGDAVVLR